jgi:chromosome segregation ATPase
MTRELWTEKPTFKNKLSQNALTTPKLPKKLQDILNFQRGWLIGTFEDQLTSLTDEELRELQQGASGHARLPEISTYRAKKAGKSTGALGTALSTIASISPGAAEPHVDFHAEYVRSVVNENTNLRAEIVTLKSTLDRLGQKYTAASRGHDNILEENAHLKETVTEFRDILTKSVLERNALRTQITQLTESAVKNLKLFQTVQRRLTEEKEKLIADYTEELAVLRTNNQKLSEKSIADLREARDEVAQLQALIVNLQKTNQELFDENARLKGESVERDASFTKLTNENAELKGAYAVLESENTTLQHQLQTIQGRDKRESQQAKRTIITLTEENLRLKEEIRKLIEKNELRAMKYEASNERHERELEELSAENTKRLKELSDLAGDEYGRLTAQFTEIHREELDRYSQCETRRQFLEQENQTYKKQLEAQKELRARLSTVNEQNLHLENQIRQSKGVHTVLKQSYAKCNLEKADLTNQMRQLEYRYTDELKKLRDRLGQMDRASKNCESRQRCQCTNKDGTRCKRIITNSVDIYCGFHKKGKRCKKNYMTSKKFPNE